MNFVKELPETDDPNPIFRQREVDRHEKNSALTGKPLEEFSLVREGANEVCGHASGGKDGRVLICKWVRLRMFIAHSVTLVNRRLRNDDRPFWVPPPYRAHRIDDSLLLWIKRTHRDNEKVRLILAKCQVFGWIVARLPDPARIEKPDERCLFGKVKNVRRLSAGLEAISYLGYASAAPAAVA